MVKIKLAKKSEKCGECEQFWECEEIAQVSEPIDVNTSACREFKRKSSVIKSGCVFTISPYHYILKEWANCKQCALGDKAHKRVVLELSHKNLVHADIIFIGEGPGKSEDVIGRSFIGKAGKLLRAAMAEAGVAEIPHILTNIVACRPCDSEGRNRPPEEHEYAACWRRLWYIFTTAKPVAIVTLGKVPEKFINQGMLWWKGRKVPFIHPAAILRRGGMGSNTYKDFVRDLTNLKEDLGNETEIEETRKRCWNLCV